MALLADPRQAEQVMVEAMLRVRARAEVATNTTAHALERYRNDPGGFVHECFG
jgi:hypothetical protein